MLKKVAVITPVRNRREKTLRFLECLYAQKGIDVAVYIVDSNSSDGTSEEIAELYPQATVVFATDDDFWTGATNRGIQRALDDGADKILTINDDAIISNTFISDLNALSEKYRIDILASRQDFEHDRGLIWSIGAYHDWESMSLFQLGYHKSRFEDLPQDVKDREIVEVEFAAGNGVLINRSVFDRIGLYDEVNYPHYHADSEFLLRARANGIISHSSIHKPILYNDISDHLRKAEQASATESHSVATWLTVEERLLALMSNYFELRSSIRSNFYGSAVRHHVENYGSGGDLGYLRNSALLINQLIEVDSPLRDVSLGLLLEMIAGAKGWSDDAKTSKNKKS
jgi:GT2 family glycosyltransferase